MRTRSLKVLVFDSMLWVFRSAPGQDLFLQSRCPRDSRQQLSYIRCLEPATFKRVSVHELQLREDKNASRAANYGAAESGSLLRTILCVLHTISLLVFSSSLISPGLASAFTFPFERRASCFDTVRYAYESRAITYGSYLGIYIYHTQCL